MKNKAKGKLVWYDQVRTQRGILGVQPPHLRNSGKSLNILLKSYSGL
jgi:hypothetical protein